MDTDLINKYVELMVRGSRAATTDAYESRGILGEAESISKALNQDELREAVRRSIVEILNSNIPDMAIHWIEYFKDFPELVDDAEIKSAAQKQYVAAVDAQLETAETIKNAFKL